MVNRWLNIISCKRSEDEGQDEGMMIKRSEITFEVPDVCSLLPVLVFKMETNISMNEIAVNLKETLEFAKVLNGFIWISIIISF